jgi:hypothetical protein
VVWPSSRSIPSGQDIIPAIEVSVEPGWLNPPLRGDLDLGQPSGRQQHHLGTRSLRDTPRVPGERNSAGR